MTILVVPNWLLNFLLQTKGTIRGLPKPQESMAHGGDFLITAQSEFSSSVGLYCAPTSHAYDWKGYNKITCEKQILNPTFTRQFLTRNPKWTKEDQEKISVTARLFYLSGIPTYK